MACDRSHDCEFEKRSRLAIYTLIFQYSQLVPWQLVYPGSCIFLISEVLTKVVTKNLAFGITASTTFEPPFSLAKRFSTLDHLTNGRIGW